MSLNDHVYMGGINRKYYFEQQKKCVANTILLSENVGYSEAVKLNRLFI